MCILWIEQSFSDIFSKCYFRFDRSQCISKRLRKSLNSGQILVNGSSFYCGNSTSSLCQLALKSDIPNVTQYVHPSTKQCNYSYTHPSTKQCSWNPDLTNINAKFLEGSTKQQIIDSAGNRPVKSYRLNLESISDGETSITAQVQCSGPCGFLISSGTREVCFFEKGVPLGFSSGSSGGMWNMTLYDDKYVLTITANRQNQATSYLRARVKDYIFIPAYT